MVEDSKQEQVRAAIHEEEKKELKVVLETSARPQIVERGKSIL